ncbi:uncharacterized protein V1518DRAFT_421585 [Limtongia smithiae]|uniref:uncharacterized protein n=1 Tax=Limtongia smithiae TaxID=1125753 RepID=UPI0034CE65F7
MFWNNTVSAAGAVMILAGVYCLSDMFAEAVFTAQETEFFGVWRKHDQHPFLYYGGMTVIIKKAALAGMQVQIPGEAETVKIGEGDICRSANEMIFRASQVVAAYLFAAMTRNDKAERKEISNAVSQITSDLQYSGEEKSKIVFSAIITGVLVGGLMRIVKYAIEEKRESAQRLEFGLSVASAAMSAIPAAGSAISSFISVMTPLVSRWLYGTDKVDHTEFLYRFGAMTEDAVLRNWANNEYVAQLFNYHMEKTIHHCGFPY